jgi:hypothetical protein
MWICTSTAPGAFMALCLISEAQGQFYLTLQSIQTSAEAHLSSCPIRTEGYFLKAKAVEA